MGDEATAGRATNKDTVSLLWDIARIPDFRKIRTDEHPQLLAQIFTHLTDPEGRIPTDWMAERVKRVDNTEGDIDTLMARIAAVRTWTYVSHQGAWMDNPQEWQDRTRAIEDRLSDALHERLTQRFVDQRTSHLAKTLKADTPLAAALHDDGALEVEGHHLGNLSGFRFVATESESTMAAKVLGSAAGKVLQDKIVERLSMLDADADAAFTFTTDGTVLWRSEPVGQFTKGSSLLHPAIKALASDLLSAEQKDAVEVRLQTWAQDLVRDRLGLLLAAGDAPLEGVARGLVFQLTESLGALPRHEANGEIRSLSKDDRHALRKLGIRIGRHLVYMPLLLRPAAVELSVLLWAVHEDVEHLAPPPAGRVSLKREKHEPEGWLRAAGFRPAGALFVRADMLERIAELAWKRLEAAKGAFEANEDFLSLAGCAADDLPGIMVSLGFNADKDGKWTPKSWRKRTPHKPKPKKAAADGASTDAPAAQGAPKPDQPHTKRSPQKHKGRRPQGSGKAPHPDAKHGHAKTGNAKPREPQFDPDSPFAKLKDLKLK